MIKINFTPVLGTILFFMIAAGLTGCAATISNSVTDDASRTGTADELPPADEYTGPRLRVGVANFLNKAPSKMPGIGEAAADILGNILKETDRFIVMSKQDVASVIDPQSRGGYSGINPATAAELGKLSGLNAVFTGQVSAYSEEEEGKNYLIYKKKKQIARVTIDCRIIDTTSGIQLMTDSSRGVCSKTTGSIFGIEPKSTHDTALRDGALRDALTRAMVKMLKPLKAREWNGRIAKVERRKVFINAGKETGLQVGSILVVQKPVEDIIDPQTGVSLGKDPGDIKGELIITAFSGRDGSVATIRSGGGFLHNDLVKLKK